MKICGLEKMSMVDYDDFIACTIFTEGCNFACPFCHNAALALCESNNTYIHPNTVIDFLEKRKKMIDAVCFSGGEPTLQANLAEFMVIVKNMGYKIKLDTNGTNPKALSNLIEKGLVDYVAMDIKNSRNNYSKCVGIENYNISDIEKSVKILKESKIAYEFRTTLVKEFHTINDIESIGEWIKGSPKYFLQQFKNSGNCIADNLTPIDENTALKMVDIAKKYVNHVALRGY